MKVCKIILRQASADLFRVERFSNTTQLSVGMMVARDKVGEWCCMKRVNVDIIGQVEDKEEKLDELGDGELTRVDALQLASQTMQDTGPGHNPF